MAVNDALFSVTGYVATQPRKGMTRSGTKTLTFRIGWTPREVSRQTGEWADLPSSFASVTCYRKIAENAASCLRKGDPIVLKGTLRVREYADQAGARRNSVDVVADFLGHDLAKGTSSFTKPSHRGQQTAEEFEWSQATAGNRLPGDVPAAQRPDGYQPEVMETDEYGAAGGADGLPEEADDLVRAALAEPDRDDDGDEADGDEADGADGDGDGADGDDRDEARELGESGLAQAGGRYRNAEPAGAAV